MTHADKLVEAFLACPKTFRFADFVTVMAAYGFKMETKGKTSGSRVAFALPAKAWLLACRPCGL